jgi:all-trans-8'-apo-beta-carotenal 15,15'-oxygenase
MATAGPWTRKGHGGWFENLFAIPTNPSNTNVLFLDNHDKRTDDNPENQQQRRLPPRLFALAEGGDPVQLDLDTLVTLDTQPFQTADGQETVQSPFAAHYKKDPLTGDIFNHGIVVGPKPSVNVMKIKSNGDLLLQSTHQLPVFTFIHDSMISENHFLLLVQPYSAPSSSLLTSVMGGKPLGQQLEWNPKEMDNQSLVLVFSKETLDFVARIPIPLLSSYHQIDAFEDPSHPHCISFRALVHDPPHSRQQVEEGFKDMYSHAKIPICQLWQYTIDIQSRTFLDSHRVAPQAGLCELPTTHADWKDYRKRYVWTNTRTEDAGYVNSLQKVDLETGECSDLISFGETSFAGNPIFVPKATPEKEDDGYILSQVYRSDEHRSDIVILDAATMKQLTLLPLNCHVPYQFHGEWYSDLP